jgi:hypothetical protein
MKGHGTGGADGCGKTAAALAVEGCICALNSIPQGPKAGHFLGAFCGRAKAMPFQNKIVPNLEMRLPWQALSLMTTSWQADRELMEENGLSDGCSKPLSLRSGP